MPNMPLTSVVGFAGPLSSIPSDKSARSGRSGVHSDKTSLKADSAPAAEGRRPGDATEGDSFILLPAGAAHLPFILPDEGAVCPAAGPPARQ
jgi:hypothetical protein